MEALRKVTEELLQQWHERDQKRKKLASEARQLEAENALVAGEIEAAMLADEKNEFRRGEFRVSFVDGIRQVKWKDEFIKVAGSEAAVKAFEAAPVPRKLSIAKV